MNAMSQAVPRLELLSVHVPKCGGSSLLTALARVFPGDELLLDYDDRPGDPASPVNLDPPGFYERAHAALPLVLRGRRAVHGHFHPRKYQPANAGFRTAIIREPLARLLSHYHFWRRLSPGPHQLHRYFLEQNLDLEGFARLPFIRHFYTRVFFGGVDFADFDYIGTLETMPATAAAIGRGIGRLLDIGVENKADASDYPEAAREIEGDSSLRQRLAGLLADDIRFYENVRARWS